MVLNWSQRVVVELSPRRVEAALVCGEKVLASAFERIEDPLFESRWPQTPSRHAGTLRSLVERLGGAGRAATILYHAPGSVATICSCPRSVSGDDAVRAVGLALAAAAEYSIDEVPNDFRSIGEDRPTSGGEAQASRHALAIADHEDTVAALESWVSAAGLRLDKATPSTAVMLAAASHAALGTAGASNSRVVALWLGEHGSALAASSDGRLNFVRPVNLGIETIVDAMGQPLRSSHVASEDLILDRAAARRLVFAAGVPSPGDPLPGHEPFTGACVLPVIQPALQRLAIEIKQSLRFGLPHGSRDGFTLLVTGTGGSIPGLSAWLGTHTGLAHIERPDAPTDLSSHGSGGLVGAYLAHADRVPGLVPIATGRRRDRRRARTVLAAGLIAAAGLISFERSAAVRERDELRALHNAAEDDIVRSEAMIGARDTLVQARRALDATRTRASRIMGAWADPALTLAAIAGASPEGLRLTTVTLSHQDGSAQGHLSGFVRLSECEDPPGLIRGLVESLARAPGVREVNLGPTQVTSIDGARSMTFEVYLGLVGLSVARPRGDVATAESTYD